MHTPKRTLYEHTTLSIGIVSADPITGRALKLLLQMAGHVAELVSPAETPGEGLTRFDLILLVGPGLTSERREAFLEEMARSPQTERIPIVHLVRASEEAAELGGRHVLWPCRPAELLRAIEAARLSGRAR